MKDSVEESLRPIEKPVTRETLRAAAEAGFIEEVEVGMQLVDSGPYSVLLEEGSDLMAIALRAEADRMEQEAQRLEEMVSLSDDPNWQKMFAPKAFGLRAHVNLNRSDADRKESINRKILGSEQK